MRTRIVPAIAVVAVCIVLAACGRSEAAGDIGALKVQEAKQIATDAYIYGYPWTSRRSTSLRSIRGDRPREAQLSF